MKIKKSKIEITFQNAIVHKIPERSIIYIEGASQRQLELFSEALSRAGIKALVTSMPVKVYDANNMKEVELR